MSVKCCQKKCLSAGFANHFQIFTGKKMIKIKHKHFFLHYMLYVMFLLIIIFHPTSSDLSHYMHLEDKVNRQKFQLGINVIPFYEKRPWELIFTQISVGPKRKCLILNLDWECVCIERYKTHLSHILFLIIISLVYKYSNRSLISAYLPQTLQVMDCYIHKICRNY